MKIKKAIIPAAGSGIRFLPSTKTIPKEMLPIVDKPTILFSVEEIIAADIHELILIAGRDKTSIEDYFDTSYELEATLERTGKLDLLRPLRDLRKHIKVISIRQQEALGLGHAVLSAESVIGKEPFALLLSDEIMITPPGTPSAIGQLVALFDQHQTSMVAVGEVPWSEMRNFGMADLEPIRDKLWKLLSAVEKPKAGTSPDRNALVGRYVFTNGIFDALRTVKPHFKNQLTDAMTLLASREGLLAAELAAERFDAREKLGFLKAMVEIGLRHKDVGASFKGYLETRFNCKIP